MVLTNELESHEIFKENPCDFTSMLAASYLERSKCINKKKAVNPRERYT